MRIERDAAGESCPDEGGESGADAGFVNFVQQYASPREEVSHQTILTERIPMIDFMKHGAILDIDGSNWSSRFPKLMCKNSVVIKVRPSIGPDILRT
mmetsp:Transcript_15018/g.32783  ORF Transcript_15018/g.32783 Transcript_15018/m.32783 type:complete len:97 (-) Transcript_15018:840-1130(-)